MFLGWMRVDGALKVVEIETGYSKASGVKIMASYTAVPEQGDGGTWSAYTLSPSLVVGTGRTKDEAVEDLRVAMELWLNYMKSTGQPVPRVSTELVKIEVAA